MTGPAIEAWIHNPLALPYEPQLRDRCRAEAPIVRDWAPRERSVSPFAELTEQELETTAPVSAAPLAQRP